ncbi:MAG: hypothetical protein CM15mP62_20440 [Rhodospirillaceae bacterium]|nr:MAG: hypothetical protein CM15mP62_20440 [Rhodospirillaceae bacterium]
MDKGEFLVMANQQTLNISVAFNGACRCQCSMSRSNAVNNINSADLESLPRKENKIMTTQKTVEA